MAQSPSAIVANLGEPNSLLRFVVAATLDGTGEPRSVILKDWAEHGGPKPSTSQAALSRYLSPHGAAIPVTWAESLQAAAHRVHGTAMADQSGLWSYQSFFRRLFPGENTNERLGPEVSAFAELTRETPRNNAELFHQAEALVELVRHSPTEDGWVEVDPEHQHVAWSIRDRLLAVSCGGGAQAQRATALLSDLAVDRASCSHIVRFLRDHPLGCKGVSILTMALQREASDGDPKRIAGSVRLRAIVDELCVRSSDDPPNEQLRAARGLFVEALGQLSPRWPLGHADWLEDALADRALDERRTARERAFAGLVYGKRFADQETKAQIRDALLNNDLIDPVAQISIRRHFNLLMGGSFNESSAGSERAEFYRNSTRSPWADAATYLNPAVEDDAAVIEAYATVASILEAAVDQHRVQDGSCGVPDSVRDATLGLLEAALFDIDAVGRRIAVDTLRCATLARPAAAALVAVLTSPATSHRSWVRCTALSALGLLQMASPEVMDALVSTAVDPGHDGDPSAVVKSALLCIGDLLSEVGQDTNAVLTGEDIGGLVDRLIPPDVDSPALEMARATANDPDALRPWHALAYAVGSARFAHPRLAELDHRLAALKRMHRWAGTDLDRPDGVDYLEDLIDRLRAEIYEVLLCDPVRAVDTDTVYRASEIFGVPFEREPPTFAAAVAMLAGRETASVTADPIMHAASVASHLTALRRAVLQQRLDCPGLDDGELTRFIALYREGPVSLMDHYERMLDAASLRPRIDLYDVARLLSMLSEGVTGQAGVDPEALLPLRLDPSLREDLGITDPDQDITLFSLASVILANALTAPIEEGPTSAE